MVIANGKTTKQIYSMRWGQVGYLKKRKFCTMLERNDKLKLPDNLHSAKQDCSGAWKGNSTSDTNFIFVCLGASVIQGIRRYTYISEVSHIPTLRVRIQLILSRAD